MAPARTDSAVEHKRGSRVVLTEDIPGVPEGTAGRLGRVVGFALKRYRVRFDNDVEVMSVAHGILVSEKDWPGVRTDRAEQARTAAEASRTR
ncbi:MAG TPA: hypothetical protein DEP66_00555, partial [Acidimicrobiaceae bacterium]|nr:hypothetical protein [Acidimicrobiaceae bacterium]